MCCFVVIIQAMKELGVDVLSLFLTLQYVEFIAYWCNGVALTPDKDLDTVIVWYIGTISSR